MLKTAKTWVKSRAAHYPPLWRAVTTLYHAKEGVKHLYRRVTRNSIFFEENELGFCSLLTEQKLAKTLELFQPRSVLDLGCGTGCSLDYFYEHGVDVRGIEGSKVAIAHAKHPELIEQHNLNHEVNLGRRFDLIWCLEVVEHIHPDYVHNLMKTFVNHADRVVLSAARPGQGGEGHFNEQPPEYWIELFTRYGYTWDQESTASFRAIEEHFSENFLVFHRPAAAGPR